MMLKILLLLSAALIFEQPTFRDILKLRAYETSFYKTSEIPNVDKLSWNSVDILVVYDINKRVQIYSNRELQIDFTKLLTDDIDKDGDQVIVHEGVDNDGIKCRSMFYVLKKPLGPRVAAIFIEYNDYTFVYRLKKNN
jgi:hypothetical protein